MWNGRGRTTALLQEQSANHLPHPFSPHNYIITSELPLLLAHSHSPSFPDTSLPSAIQSLKRDCNPNRHYGKTALRKLPHHGRPGRKIPWWISGKRLVGRSSMFEGLIIRRQGICRRLCMSFRMGIISISGRRGIGLRRCCMIRRITSTR